ncbi:type II toxin-antitoxin system death-on-curing family toxin [Micromonospora sp. CV4]|uniref:type II toxin-antitoxin system death-on-curing family toxin n=1 Tax=Micromonospora sp. CV4 TaxID=2478711 RepID=UPI000EF51087|nr:type II toxin-antitoxin system death-on-curing family toxin [Micromonospora sp. CV4]RLP96833.1 type II toxin-antitoxin system death-on-curing family toxin [Micromonospora sp. CV4]
MTEVRYPTLADVAGIARKLSVGIRDAGLVESAVARPQTSVLGEDAYPDLWTKAAALLHSLVSNHPFVDGNKRIGWIVAVAFLLQNRAVTLDQLDEMDQDVAYDLVISVTESRLTEVAEISAALRKLF